MGATDICTSFCKDLWRDLCSTNDGGRKIRDRTELVGNFFKVAVQEGLWNGIVGTEAA